MFKKGERLKSEEKVIDIEAGLEGKVKFSSPVNLRISGKFEGELEARGVLIIGQKADVKAKVIKGEDITIAGRVKGDIVCSKRLELSPSAKVTGNIQAPLLVVNQGAMLKGNCLMPFEEKADEVKERPKRKKR